MSATELKLEEAAYFDFCTHHPTTAAVTDADSTPTAEVFEDATDTTVVALTVTKRTSKTGNYRVPVTAAAADGFEVNKTYNVIASATVNGITGKGVIGRFKVRARGKDDLAFPTTSGRGIDVASTGEVGLDFDNIKAATGATTLTNITVPTVTTLTNAPSDSAGVTTLLNRLGAFTGTGVNTVLGFLKALMSKTASTPSDVGGTFDPSTDATEAIRDRGDSAWTTATGFSTHSAADVWAVGTRTLTSFGTLVADIWSNATRTLTAFSDSSGVTTLLGKLAGITLLAEWLGALAGKQTANTTARNEIRATGAGSGTFNETTDSLEAVRDRGDAAWTTATGFSTLDAAGVRTAVGLASANLDTQLGDLPTNAELATALAAADDAVLAVIAALNNISAADVLTQVNAALTTPVADSIPADGSRPSIAQAAYMNTQFLLERSVSGTTLTVKKPDGSTLMTLTLGDANSPTSLTRTT